MNKDTVILHPERQKSQIGARVRGWLVFVFTMWLTGAVSQGAIVFEGEIPSAILGKPRRVHI
jgi:hypothetical protein